MLARIGRLLVGDERARACARFRLLARPHVASARTRELDSLDASFWVTWHLAHGVVGLFVQCVNDDTTTSTLYAVDDAADTLYELTTPAFEFRRGDGTPLDAIVLEGEFVLAADDRVAFLATTCLYNRVHRGSVDAQSRMMMARALIETPGALVRAARDTPTAVLDAIHYKPHMTAVNARAVLDAVPQWLARYSPAGIELRCSSAPHVPGSSGRPSIVVAVAADAAAAVARVSPPL